MTMRSKILAASVFAISALAALPALADGDGKHTPPSFPIAGAEYKQHVDARVTRMRAHLEEKASKLTADQAKELRVSFEASVAKMNAEVAKAIADGKVTKEEFDAVRAASPHHGHGKGGDCQKKPAA